MSGEYWTLRYSPPRLPPSPLSLKAPLTRVWKRDAEGPVLVGTFHVGDEAIFSTVGDGRVSKIELSQGEVVWADYFTAGALLRDGDTILTCNNFIARWLRPDNGEILAEKSANVGLADSFIANGALVGALPGCLQVLDAVTLAPLWRRPGIYYRCFAANDELLVAWSLHGEGLTCHDLRSGAVRWERSQADVGEPYLLGCIWQDKFINIQGHLKALDLATGRTLWEWPSPDAWHWWHPYDGRAYIFIWPGRYIIVDMATGKQLFERDLGPHVPMPMQKRKGGLRVVSGSRQAPSWQYVRLSVSETHAFIANASGQIVVLARDTGELEQVVEIDGMPVMMEPIIYRNHLLIHDFNAAIYCFKGAE